MIRVLCWENRPLDADNEDTGASPLPSCREVPVEEAGAAWRERGARVWIDVPAPTRAEMELLAAEFDLHDIVIRNALAPNSRPRLEDYGNFLTIALYVPRDPSVARSGGSVWGAPPFGVSGTGLAPISEIDFVFSERYLITAHPEAVPLLGRLLDDARNDPKAMAEGMGRLVHRVLDEAVDSYFPALDTLVEQVEAVQEFAFVGTGSRGEAADRAAMLPLFRLKKGLLALRRVMAPQADALRILAREGVAFYQDPVPIDFQDVFDRATRVEQIIELNQSLLINARESFLTRVSNELGLTTQALLVLTCLILVPLFFTALYGMNFDLIPEAHLPIGHGWAIGLIVVVDGAVLYYFRRQHWT